MARSDGRVEQGQKLSTAISARAWNRAQDAADIVLGVRPGIASDPWNAITPGCAHITAQSVAAYPMLQFSVASLIDYGDQGLSQNDGAIAQHVFPRAGPGWVAGSRGVLLEPLIVNKIGKIAVAGVVQCWLNVVDESHGWCSPEADQDPIVVENAYVYRTRMQTAWTGDCEIIWKQSGTGTKIGVIRLNTPRRTMITYVSSYWERGTPRTVALYSTPSNPIMPANSSVTSFTDPQLLSSSNVTAMNFIDNIPPQKWATLEQRDGNVFVTSWGPQQPFLKNTIQAPWYKNDFKNITQDGFSYVVSNPWGDIVGTGSRSVLWRITSSTLGELLAADCRGA